MDIQSLSTLIGSLGFPIFACCVMFVQNQNLQKTLGDISLTMQKMADDLDDVKKGDKDE